MNAAIVDDEPAFFSQISELLQVIASQNNVNVKIDFFKQADEFYRHYKSEKYDVLFLDIDMPDINGFELTEMLQRQDDNVKIVYITNRDDLVVYAFRYKALGFVRKKHIENELPYAMSTLFNEIKNSSKSVILTEVRSKGGNIKSVSVDSIVYIETHGHDAYVNLLNGEQLVVRKSLSEFLRMPEFEKFVYINSGTIVNLLKIKLQGTNVVLPDEKVLFISRRKMKDVRDAYLKSLRRVLI